jgi:pyridoxal phosphate enzyme (YggS family)
MLDAGTLSANLDRVRGKIATACARDGRDPATVTLMAVTKTVSPSTIALASTLGIKICGENRVQEARTKVDLLPDLRWELIGPLQRNKIRAALAIFSRIQTIEDEALARDLERVAAERNQIMPVLIQINVVGETTKHGVAPEEALRLAERVAALPHILCEGLMTVAPIARDSEGVRPVFARLRELRDTIGARIAGSWHVLSMGMSDDFTVAIEEGSTIIRIGRALFGER